MDRIEISDHTMRCGSIGIVIVDHGSQRVESNEMLLEMVQLFRDHTGYINVEAAHMEIAEPSIDTAFDRCVAAGAKMVIVCPFILLPGRHWKQDIPRLAAIAAARHPGLQHRVAAPLGVHTYMADILMLRLEECLGVRGSEQGSARA